VNGLLKMKGVRKHIKRIRRVVHHLPCIVKCPLSFSSNIRLRMCTKQVSMVGTVVVHFAFIHKKVLDIELRQGRVRVRGTIVSQRTVSVGHKNFRVESDLFLRQKRARQKKRSLL
jgi:hypothetical protein